MTLDNSAMVALLQKAEMLNETEPTVPVGEVWIEYTRNENFCRRRFVVYITADNKITKPYYYCYKGHSPSRKIFIPQSMIENLDKILTSIVKSYISEQKNDCEIIDFWVTSL